MTKTETTIWTDGATGVEVARIETRLEDMAFTSFAVICGGSVHHMVSGSEKVALHDAEMLAGRIVAERR